MRVESSAKSGVFSVNHTRQAPGRHQADRQWGTPTCGGITQTHRGNVIFLLGIVQPRGYLLKPQLVLLLEGAREYVSFHAFCACPTGDYGGGGGGDQYSLGVGVVSLFRRFPISDRHRGRGRSVGRQRPRRPPSLFRTRMSRATRRALFTKCSLDLSVESEQGKRGDLSLPARARPTKTTKHASLRAPFFVRCNADCTCLNP